MLTCSFPSGLAVLDHVLTPRMKASHIAIETMRDHLDAVYDVTVVYEGTLGTSSERHPAPSMPGMRLFQIIQFFQVLRVDFDACNNLLNSHTQLELLSSLSV